MAIMIRTAERADALQVAAIIDIAGHGIEADFWNANLDEDGSALSAARRMILEDPSLPYHFSRCWLLEVDGEPAGGLIGGLNADTPEIALGFPSYFAPLLELETLVPGYWAVIAVTVYREFRGQRLARQILDFGCSEAERCGAKGLSIVVEDTNEAAIGLYRRWGFVDHSTRPWVPYRDRTGPGFWVLLVKPF